MKYFITAALVMLAAPTLALDYWPDDAGEWLYRYRGAEGQEIVMEITVLGDDHWLSRTYALCSHGEEYRITDVGAGLASYGFMCEGAVDPDLYFCDPPIPIVSSSTHEDSQIVHECQINGSDAAVVVTTNHMSISVPLGVFDVAQIHCLMLVGPAHVPPIVWLDAQLGPVRIGEWELVVREPVVALQTRSWSAVKQLFD